MQNSSDLLNMLRSIHRKSYPAYKSLRAYTDLTVILYPSTMYREIPLRLPLTSAYAFPLKTRAFRQNIIKTPSPEEPSATSSPDSSRGR